MKICKIENCQESVYFLGLCRSHHRKFKLYGVANLPDRKKGPAKTFCKVCGKPNRSRINQLCDKHFARFCKHGDPNFEQPTREELYHSSYKRSGDNDCWVWQRGRDKNGYGKLTFKHFHTDRAHRFGWELANSKRVPKGMLVCHTCDNPPCQNPKHLFIGTPKENMADKIRKGRLVANPNHDSSGRFCSK